MSNLDGECRESQVASMQSERRSLIQNQSQSHRSIASSDSDSKKMVSGRGVPEDNNKAMLLYVLRLGSDSDVSASASSKRIGGSRSSSASRRSDSQCSDSLCSCQHSQSHTSESSLMTQSQASSGLVTDQEELLDIAAGEHSRDMKDKSTVKQSLAWLVERDQTIISDEQMHKILAKKRRSTTSQADEKSKYETPLW